MKVDGVHYRTIWDEDQEVRIIDQSLLPYEFQVVPLKDLAAAARAIRTMRIRGAPAIGAAAAYGMALGMREDSSDTGVARARRTLLATRPTAVNLSWALERTARALTELPAAQRVEAAFSLARQICDEDVEANRALGGHLLEILREQARPDRPVNVLTHCNAGWLATVDLGTATSGIYLAHDEGLLVHVWVDETRPRRQGGRLTAWELGKHGVPHTVIPDVAAAHVLSRGKVDLVIVGTDRTTITGEVANKIGTYPVALAAWDNRVPFYVAAPSASIDFTIRSGEAIPIEERPPEEVVWVTGRTSQGDLVRVQVLPDGSPAANYAFDVTPSQLVTGLVTERGVVRGDGGSFEHGLRELFPDR